MTWRRCCARGCGGWLPGRPWATAACATCTACYESYSTTPSKTAASGASASSSLACAVRYLSNVVFSRSRVNPRSTAQLPAYTNIVSQPCLTRDHEHKVLAVTNCRSNTLICACPSATFPPAHLRYVSMLCSCGTWCFDTKSWSWGVPRNFTCLVHLTDEPYALERLEAVLKPIMWRNDKASVGDELVLPGRTLEVRLNAPHPHSAINPHSPAS